MTPNSQYVATNTPKTHLVENTYVHVGQSVTVSYTFAIYTKKTVFNLEAIVFSISSIQKVVQFSKSNPTNYLEESRDKQHHCSRFVYYLKPLHSTLIRQFMAFYCYLYVFRRLWTFWIESVVSLYKAFQNDHLPLTK